MVSPMLTESRSLGIPRRGGLRLPRGQRCGTPVCWPLSSRQRPRPASGPSTISTPSPGSGQPLLSPQRFVRVWPQPRSKGTSNGWDFEMTSRIKCLLVLWLPVLLECALCSGATVSWVGGSGDWNTATNWSTGALPGTNDTALINTPGGPFTITHSVGTHTVQSLQSQQAFTLSGGSLTVSNTVQINSTFTLSGGALVGATVLQPTNNSALIVNGLTAVLNGVTVNGTLDVGNGLNAVEVTVTNRLVLNGTLLVGNPTNGFYGGVTFAGTQTLGGSGTVIFGDNANYSFNSLRLSLAGTTLTIGPAITIGGQNGVLGYASAWGGPAGVSVINQGNISAASGGGTVTFAGAALVNQVPGTLSVSNGGVLTLASTSLTNTGTINASNGTVTLAGTFVTSHLDRKSVV